MTLRFSSSRALGLAVALVLGSVASAAAQLPDSTARQRRDERNRVRKEQQEQTPATPTTSTPTTPTTPSTTTTGSVTTGATGEMVGRVRDTVIVQCNCPAATSAVATGEVIPLIRPRGPKVFGNGLYVGVSGSSTLPVGDLYKAYSEGWGAAGYLGWDHHGSPVGLRLALGYQELNGRTFGPMIRRGMGRMDVINDFGGAGVDAREFNMSFNGKFRVPFGKFLGATSGAYALAGASVHHFRDYNSSLFLTNNFYGRGINSTATESSLLTASRGESSNITRLGWNGGAGLSLGVGNAEMFVETRYQRVYTPGRAINYMPIVAGVQIH
jgi:hypothetical protein